jgi:hypothetical protein
MKQPLITTKLSQQALKLARLIAALTGEKQYEVIERALKLELERIQNQQAPG